MAVTCVKKVSCDVWRKSLGESLRLPIFTTPSTPERYKVFNLGNTKHRDVDPKYLDSDPGKISKI